MDIYKLNFTILELELLFFLSLRTGEKFSQRDLAKILKVSPTAIANSVKFLEEKLFIKIEKTKTINFITYNRENKEAINFKKISNLKNIYFSGLVEFLEEKLAGSTIILFGSYLRGEDSKNSDIDIAIIGRKEKKLDLENFEQKLYRKINLNFYKDWKEINKYLKNNILSGYVLVGGINL
jgi:predicted nucleotidyltransferase